MELASIQNICNLDVFKSRLTTFLFKNLFLFEHLNSFNPRSLGGGGQIDPLDFFGFKFLLLDR